MCGDAVDERLVVRDVGRWLAVEGSGISGSVAIPSVTATASGISFALNSATGASRLSWATAVVGGPLTVLGAPIDLSSALLNALHGTLDNFSIAGVVTGHGEFDLSTSIVSASSFESNAGHVRCRCRAVSKVTG